MSTKFIQDGDILNVTAGAAKTSNDVEEFGACIGVWLADTANGSVGSVQITGVFELAKETGVAFAVGDKLYWDATNDNLDKTDTNIPAGVAAAVAASGATVAQVLLNPGV